MSGVSAVGAARPVPRGTIACAGTAPAHAAMLPDPAIPTAEGLHDAMSLLYAMMQKLDEASTAASKQGVVTQTAAKNDQIKREKDALDKQVQAKKDADNASHGFWHTLGKVAGIVGSVVAVAAASVVTFGSAAVAVAVVAVSVAGTVMKETGLGGAVGQWIGMGLSAAASVCTLGLGSMGTVAQIVTASGDAASGVGDVANGVSNEQVDRANAAADDAAADASRAKQQLDRHQRSIEELLGLLKALHDSHAGAQQSLQQAMGTNDQTSVALATQIGRA